MTEQILVPFSGCFLIWHHIIRTMVFLPSEMTNMTYKNNICMSFLKVWSRFDEGKMVVIIKQNQCLLFLGR